ncbi:MAG: integration host factor [Actinobacteria bacterium]|nr:integration host factor [Actinomycetota bacterium]
MSTTPWGKTELRTAIVERSGIPAGMVDGVLAALASVVVEQVSQGTKLQIPGVATIDVVQRSARTGRNPQTGETMEIPARRAVKITPSAPLKRAAAGA